MCLVWLLGKTLRPPNDATGMPGPSEHTHTHTFIMTRAHMLTTAFVLCGLAHALYARAVPSDTLAAVDIELGEWDDDEGFVCPSVSDCTVYSIH